MNYKHIDTMHPLNRPHSVDKSTGDFLYSLYTLLFDAKHLELSVKQRTFETAAVCPHSWRVVSISVDALRHINENKSAKGLHRAHVLSRNERAWHMFNRDSPLNQDDLLLYFFEHDTVALVTTLENAKDGTSHWSRLYAVPFGILCAGSFSIYARKCDLDWAENLGQS